MIGHEQRMKFDWSPAGHQQESESSLKLSVCDFVECSPPISGSLWQGIWAEIKRWKPDVVLSNNIEVPPTGCPTVCIVHDLNFGEPGGRHLGVKDESWSSRLRRTFYGICSKALHRVVSVSETSRMALLAAGVSDSRIAVIPNGVDTDRFCPRSIETDKEGVTFTYPSRNLTWQGAAPRY